MGVMRFIQQVLTIRGTFLLWIGRRERKREREREIQRKRKEERE